MLKERILIPCVEARRAGLKMLKINISEIKLSIGKKVSLGEIEAFIVYIYFLYRSSVSKEL